MANLPPGGTMAAVFAPVEEVTRSSLLGDRLAIAAVNAADSVVISGEESAVDAALAQLAARGVQGHRLYISLAAFAARRAGNGCHGHDGEPRHDARAAFRLRGI